MKNIFKSFVVAVLGWQVRRLRKKHSFVTIGVAGSVGKTSTKLAIAQIISKSKKVRYQDGNYNDIVSVPLIYFGHKLPSLMNPVAWLKIFLDNEKQIGNEYNYEVVVLELGTDKPGDITGFKKYVHLDYAVLTAVAPEHMEFFHEIGAVANEEIAIKEYADHVIYGQDMVAPEHRELLPQPNISYSLHDNTADYHLANILKSSSGLEADLKQGEDIFLHVKFDAIADVQLYPILAATIVAKEIGLKSNQISEGINAVRPVSGRLRRLRGINNSTIIDDTYNASPDAVKAALRALYDVDAPQRIAILGSMNELGDMSADAHEQIGEMCDPSKLALVVTIGREANTNIAPAAESKGCSVKKFDSPYDAGEFVQTKVETNAVILAKGSQNGVFAEEAVKALLADPEDIVKLVRQSPVWMAKKGKQFKRG